MPVTRNDVDHIAVLARLEFSDAERDRMVQQLGRILEYIEKLNSLDTTGVEPLTQVIESQNAFREDTVQPSLTREEVLKNAPARSEKYFTVPKVLP